MARTIPLADLKARIKEKTAALKQAERDVTAATKARDRLSKELAALQAKMPAPKA